MALLVRLPWYRRLLYRLSPKRRRAHEARFRAGLRWLVEHPEEPVYFR